MVAILIACLLVCGVPGITSVTCDGLPMAINGTTYDPRPFTPMTAKVWNGQLCLAMVTIEPVALSIMVDLSPLSDGPWVINWQSTAPAIVCDLGRDGLLGQDDFGLLQRCLSGPDVAPFPGCLAADFDRTYTVDAGDVAYHLAEREGWDGE